MKMILKTRSRRFFFCISITGAERLIEAKPDLQEHMEEETENIL